MFDADIVHCRAVAGPFVLGLIRSSDLKPLSYVTQFALAFIAFSAGAELYLPELRSLFKSIISQTTCIAVRNRHVFAMSLYLSQSPVFPSSAGHNFWRNDPVDLRDRIRRGGPFHG